MSLIKVHFSFKNTEIKRLEHQKKIQEANEGFIIKNDEKWIDDLIKEKKHEAKVKKNMIDKVTNKIITRTGFTIDLSKVSNTITNLRDKYELQNKEVSFLRAKSKFKDEVHDDKPIKAEHKMGPEDFAATITNILNEKLTIRMNRQQKQPMKHMFDHINTNLIMKQKDQVLKSYREPIDKIMTLDTQNLASFKVQDDD